MNSKLIHALVFALLGTSTAVLAAESLPVIVVKSHQVALGFPAESLVEAVQQTTVGAQIAGRVTEVRADAGQAVRKGDLLMRIDAREADEAARAAEAQYINAKLNYERHKSLKDQKFVSQAAMTRRVPISMRPLPIVPPPGPARVMPQLLRRWTVSSPAV